MIVLARVALRVVVTTMVLGVPSLVAQQPSGGTDEGTRIFFFSPRADQPAVGAVELWVDVTSDLEVTRVIFRVDGRETARFSEGPYQQRIPLGDENVEHRFEVLVRSPDQEIARAVRVTPRLQVDEELELELRQLYVTVESAGSRVTGLGQDDFEIKDNQEPQTIVTFEGGDAPLAAVILVDSSISMRGRPLEAAVAGARAFVDGLLPLDEASITLFSDRTLSQSPFISAGDDAGDALSSLQAVGGTALNDHLYYATKTLESRQGRRVVVLLSDGIDIHSALDIEDVRWSVQRSQSIIYWIELNKTKAGKTAGRVISPWRDREEHEHEYATLRSLVEESGGRILSIEDVEQIPEVFARILRELREQYVLGYYPTSDLDDGAWHDILVRTLDRSLEARSRRGYWDLR